MSTALIKKEKSIPSILVNKDFITKLGKIIERESIERTDIATSEVAIITQKREDEIKKSGYYGTKEKEAEAIKEMREHEWKMAKPHFSVFYKLGIRDNESIEFSSVNDILNTTLLPEGINSISFRVTHYDSNYVDIEANISKPYGAFFVIIPRTYSLSSKNEGELLKIEKQLDNLFNQSRLEYHNLLYPKSGTNFLIISFLISATIGMGAGHFIFSTSRDITPGFFYTATFLGLYSCYLTSKLIKYLYPFYEFELSDGSSVRKTIKYIATFFLLTLLTAAIAHFFEASFT